MIPDKHTFCIQKETDKSRVITDKHTFYAQKETDKSIVFTDIKKQIPRETSANEDFIYRMIYYKIKKLYLNVP